MGRHRNFRCRADSPLYYLIYYSRIVVGEFLMTRHSFFLAFLACLLGLPAVAPSFAEEVDDDNSRRCINIRKLKRTEVVDDQHVLFYMFGKTIYLNALERRCRGLARERRFAYSTYSGSLCSFDTIEVLLDFGGDLQTGASCRLGRFFLTSEEEIEAAREKSLEPAEIVAPAGADEEEVGTEAEDPAN
jgi:hypothetical protein